MKIRYLFQLFLVAISIETFATEKATKTIQLKELVVALKPDKNPDTMLSERKEFETQLSKLLNIPVKVIIPTSSAVIIEGLANGSIDIGYLSSVDMVNAEKNKAGQILLVGELNGKTHYESIWLVKSDSKLTKLSELKNKSIAFSSRTSTSGYLIPYWDLVQKKLISPKQRPEVFFGEGNVWYGSGYVTAVQKVLDGTAEAAAVSDYVFFEDKHLNIEQKKNLKILTRQGPVPSHVLAIRSSLSQEQFQKLQIEFLNLCKNETILAEKIFSSKLVKVESNKHLQTTKEALELTGLL